MQWAGGIFLIVLGIFAIIAGWSSGKEPIHREFIEPRRLREQQFQLYLFGAGIIVAGFIFLIGAYRN